MADCPRVSSCSFYATHAETQSDLAEELRGRYCKSNYLACARYSVGKALGEDRVPDALFPNQHAEARRLLSES